MYVLFVLRIIYASNTSSAASGFFLSRHRHIKNFSLPPPGRSSRLAEAPASRGGATLKRGWHVSCRLKPALHNRALGARLSEPQIVLPASGRDCTAFRDRLKGGRARTKPIRHASAPTLFLRAPPPKQNAPGCGEMRRAAGAMTYSGYINKSVINESPAEQTLIAFALCF